MTAARSSTGEPEGGSASVWALLVTATAFTLLLGLVVDGGRVIDARLASSRTAAQAARLGADELSQSSVRNGRDAVDVSSAITHAQSYLHQAGLTGTVHVAGDTVTVTVTGRSQTQILGILGIGSFPVHEVQTARAITEEDS
jgi:Flp pilus assembly protein TadG